MSEATIQNMDQLADKTCFLLIEFNRFGNSRKVDVKVETAASQDRFRHNKTLLNSPELQEIAKRDSALRVWLDKPNRCWRLGASMRCVAYDLVDEVFEKCNAYLNERPSLVEACGQVYLQQIAEAQKDLGPQFNADDYPTLEEFLKEFDMTFKILTFSTPEKLKITSPKVYAMEKAKESEQLKLASVEIRAAQRVLLAEYVNKLLETLKPTEGKKKKLHKATVEKLQDFLITFDLRNVTDDAELKTQVDKLQLIMAGVDTEKIKNSDNLKADIIKSFSEASEFVSNLPEVKGRKIRA
jgi:hypothetical protein